MSNRFDLRRGRLAGIALAMVVVFALPAAAQAAPVDLATAGPFVVLGGTTVTNTGPSVLNGNLGVSPGTELKGFESACRGQRRRRTRPMKSPLRPSSI